MATTSIEWTEAVWNPVTGCTRASAGCDNCYAATMTRRLAAMGQDKYQGLINPGKKHFNGVVKCHDDVLDLPLRWRKGKRIFVNSMSDLFHPNVPFEFIDRVFAVMALCPQHTFQVLTKRPERMAWYLSEFYSEGGRLGYMMDDSLYPESPLYGIGDETFEHLASIDYLPNVWIGTSVESQEAADERIPHLLRCPAAVRWLSMEPLLGPVDLSTIRHGNDPDLPVFGTQWGPDWIVVGGESGSKARPMHPDWVRSIRDQCQAAGVPFLFKQHGAYVGPENYSFEMGLPDLASGKRYVFPDGTEVFSVGKHASGRLLDGQLHDAYPEAHHA